MKTTILLAIAAATGLSFAAGVNAGDLFTSTKGAQLQYDLRKVPGTTPEVPDRSVKAGSPKALDFAYSVRSVPGSTPDVLVRNLPAAPPRLLANEPWRFHQFQLSAVLYVVTALTRLQAASVSLAEFPFEFREGLLWIQVAIPQTKRPLNFLVDTGARVSVINLSTAKRIGSKLGREVRVHGVQTTLKGYWRQHMSAKVGDVELPREYLAVDLEKLSSSCERSVDGLLGADSFRVRTVQIDFDAQMIRLAKPEKNGKPEEALPLQLRPCGMRVPISVNGCTPQWVRLDNAR